MAVAQIEVKQFALDTAGSPYVLLDVYRPDDVLPTTPWIPDVRVAMDPTLTDQQNVSAAIATVQPLVARQLALEALVTRGAAWIGRIIQVPA